MIAAARKLVLPQTTLLATSTPLPANLCLPTSTSIPDLIPLRFRKAYYSALVITRPSLCSLPFPPDQVVGFAEHNHRHNTVELAVQDYWSLLFIRPYLTFIPACESEPGPAKLVPYPPPPPSQRSGKSLANVRAPIHLRGEPCIQYPPSQTKTEQPQSSPAPPGTIRRSAAMSYVTLFFLADPPPFGTTCFPTSRRKTHSIQAAESCVTAATWPC